jgi:YVTN family beta-propeller protein
VTGTDLHQPEAAALAAQALIEEARRLHRRRQRNVLVVLAATALLVGAVVSAVVVLSNARSKPSTSPAPRVDVPAAPTHNTAYITTSAGIVGVDLATRSIVRRIEPHGSRLALGPIAIAAGGHTAYVVSDNVLTPIDLATGRAEASITFGPATGGLADGSGFPSSIAIAPDGRTAYIAVPAYGTMVPVDLAPLAAGTPIDLGGHLGTIAIAPSGLTAYVTNQSTGAVDVVNLTTDVVEDPIVGIADPQEIAVAPNGQRAYVSAGNNVVSSVVPIDLASGRVLAPIEVGSPRAGFLAGPIAVSPDGRTVYTTNVESAVGGAQVSVLSTASNKVIAQFGGFSGPAGIALVGGTRTLYVLNMASSSGIRGITLGEPRTVIDDNALVPINLADRRVGPIIRIPASPRALGVAPS